MTIPRFPKYSGDFPLQFSLKCRNPMLRTLISGSWEIPHSIVRHPRSYTTFDSPLAGALSYSGPNALLYAINVVVPQLSNALSGKPVADLATA